MIGREELFDGSRYRARPSHPMYDVAPDGRFLMLEIAEDRTEIALVRNFFTELEGIAPN